MDFQRDFDEFLIADIAAIGVTIEPQQDNESDDVYRNRIRYQYYNYRYRYIVPKPRNVLRSKEFQYPAEYQNAITQIENKITNGDNLLPYFSTRMADPDYKDDMLNDWGIYHLHLGNTIQPNGFVERTGPLLYARFDDNNAYFINVYPHQAWTKQQMIQTIHDNWPTSIQNYKLNDVIGLSHVPTDNDIKQFRRAHVNSGVELGPGIVYMPIGGGMMADGSSLKVAMDRINLSRWISDLESQFASPSIEILKRLKDRNADINNLAFKLVFDNGRFLVLETNSNVAFPLKFH